jgi:NADP-dependent 3-hydroxy acid dehydrogenase YdfG
LRRFGSNIEHRIAALAEAIAFAIALPKHVNVRQVAIKPTRQVG